MADDIDTLRDRLAGLCGWEYRRCVCELCKKLSDYEASGWVSSDPNRAGLSPAHPFPAGDLTALGAAWPEGWEWERKREDGAYWWAAFPDDWDGEEYPTVIDTGNEWADRLRLTVAVLEAMAAGKGGE